MSRHISQLYDPKPAAYTAPLPSSRSAAWRTAEANIKWWLFPPSADKNGWKRRAGEKHQTAFLRVSFAL